MKKIFKIVLTNLLLILIVVCSIEFIALYTFYREKVLETYNDDLPYNTEFKYYFKSLFDKYKRNKYIFCNEFRPAVGTEYNEPAILLLGCSYTYGSILQLEETFQYKLSKKTKRPVYNFGLEGASANEMLYILRNDELRNKLLNNNNNIEYVIFTYITDHIPRLYAPVYRRPSPVFIPSKDFLELKLKNEKSLLYRSYFYFFISRYFASKEDKYENSFNLVHLYLKEMKKETEKHFKNNNKKPQFVVLIYDDYIGYPWEQLEEDGIKVLFAEKITQTDLKESKYRIPNDHHPSSKAWDIIVPALVKELNIK